MKNFIYSVLGVAAIIVAVSVYWGYSFEALLHDGWYILALAVLIILLNFVLKMAWNLVGWIVLTLLVLFGLKYFGVW